MLTRQYKVRVIYKSGAIQDFWAWSFSIKNNTYEWHAVSQEVRPVHMGVDEIAAVWQVGTRYRLKFGD